MIKILFLAANPMDMEQGRLEEECRKIDNALRTAEYRDRFHLVSHWAVRVSDVQEILLREKPHIVHFSGHGSFANEIVLQDDQGNAQPLAAEALAHLFAILKDNVRCVVFSGSCTAPQGQVVAQYVDCVIGMSKAIEDSSAAEFAEAFYRALGFGRNVQTAFDLGRVALESEHPAEADAPQLFLSSSAASSITLASSMVEEGALSREFPIARREIERNKSIFSEPASFEIAENQLASGRVFWIIGPPGIGKRTAALALARKWCADHQQTYDASSIYSVPRHIQWAYLEQSNPRNAAIILPDTLGAISFDRGELDVELVCLERLARKGNLVIATSPDDVFDDAKMRTRRFAEWLSTNAHITALSHRSYDDKTRQAMFRNLLTYACDSGMVSPHQERLADEVLSGEVRSSVANSATRDAIGQAHAQFLGFLRSTWIPVDIDRFVFTSLPSVRSVRDFVALLQQGADIDSRIRTWFGSLDPATQSFVFTLALFAGLNDRSLWQKYKEVAQHLLKLNPMLPIMPLGILRQRAAPYVTAVGPIDFADSSVYRAVIHEISQSYREYFVELRDKLKEWTASPEGQSTRAQTLPSPDTYPTATSGYRRAQALVQSPSDGEDATKYAAETESLRNAVARVVGEVAKQSLDDVLPILHAWGSHPRARIGRTVGLALSETATDPVGGEAALSLLHDWAVDLSEGARYRRRSAAAAFGQIGLIPARIDLQDYALQDLQLLARDHDDYIRTEVAFAASRLAGSLPLSRIRLILTKLARAEYDEHRKDRLWAYRDVARAIDLVAIRDSASVLRLIESWVTSNAATARQAGGYMLLSCAKLDNPERHAMLQSYMTAQPSDFVAAVMLSTSGDDAPAAWSVLRVLASAGPRGSRRQLIEALAEAAIDGRSDMESLRSSLHEGLPTANIADLLLMVDTLTHCHEIEQLVQDSPVAVIDRMAEFFERQPALYSSVISRLAQEPPEGIRAQLIQALADGAPGSPTRYQQIVTQLTLSSDAMLSQIREEVDVLLFNRASDLWMRFISDLILKHPEEVVAQLAALLVSPTSVSSLQPAETETVGKLIGPDRLPDLALSVISRLAQMPPRGIHQELVDALAKGAAQNPKAYSDLAALLALSSVDDVTGRIPYEVADQVLDAAIEAWAAFMRHLTPGYSHLIVTQLAQLLDTPVVVPGFRLWPSCDAAENLGQLIPPNRLPNLVLSIITRLAQTEPECMHQQFIEALIDGARTDQAAYSTVTVLLATSDDPLLQRIPAEVEIGCHNREVDERWAFLEDLIPAVLLNPLKAPFKRRYHPENTQ